MMETEMKRESDAKLLDIAKNENVLLHAKLTDYEKHCTNLEREHDGIIKALKFERKLRKQYQYCYYICAAICIAWFVYFIMLKFAK